MPLQVIVMGVSSTGKSTIAAALAEQLGWDFLEGDDLHPRSNVAKMESGQPLTDEDRAPWLRAIAERAGAASAEGCSTVITCSALKRQYRDLLRQGADATYFVHLHGSQELLETRMAKRERHFMPTSLLASQLDTLEPLDDDEDGIVLDVAGTVDQIVAQAARAVSARLRT